MDRQNPMLIERPTPRNIALIGLPVGVDYDYHFPIDKLVEILSVYVVFDTDGNAANRRLILGIIDAGIVQYGNFPAPFSQTANLIYTYTWAPGTSHISPAVMDGHAAFGFPAGFILQPGWGIRIETFNIQAGDQIDNLGIVYKEWQLPVWP